VWTPRGGHAQAPKPSCIHLLQGIELIDISYAASIGVVLFLVVFALTLIQLRVFRFRELD